MTKLFFSSLILIHFFVIFQGSAFAARNIYELITTNIEGKDIPLRKFKGNILLVVNTASRCGYTPQYKSLEEIYNRYKDKGFVVLAFPSNDFRQELSSNEEIKEFCNVMQVSFPIFAEGKVKGIRKQNIFKVLTEDVLGKSKGEIRCNFEKFLVDREGNLFKRFRSSVDPREKQMIDAIESLL